MTELKQHSGSKSAEYCEMSFQIHISKHTEVMEQIIKMKIQHDI